jgi:hypothetical protein
LAILFGGNSSSVAATFEIVVPAYFYPSTASGWKSLNAAAGRAPVTVIMNPSNGPGKSLDANYVAAVDSLRAAGGRVIGYVHTSYAARPLQQVLADIDRYDSWYNLDGIFVDEMANTGPAERLNYYRDIYNHVKAIDPSWEVMGNPGTTTLEQYLTWPTADRLMVFENVGTTYPPYTPSSWNFSYDRSKFVHLVHTETSPANMLAHLNLAVQRNAGGIYVTNDVLPNPWDRLPGFWTSLVDAVATINADYNNNGVVDAADQVVWRNTLGQTGTGLAADGNGDGKIDSRDDELWRSHFGQSTVSTVEGTATFSEAIPEPLSVVLLISAVTGAALCLRRLMRRFEIAVDARQLP